MAADSEKSFAIVKRVVWAVALLAVLCGIIVAITTQSWWPLLLCVLIVLPLFPIGSPMTKGRKP